MEAAAFLCTPSGALIDRVTLPKQYVDVSYGRVSGRDGFYFMDASTPGEANSAVGYSFRCEKPAF